MRHEADVGKLDNPAWSKSNQQAREPDKLKEDEAGLSLSKLVSPQDALRQKLEAGSPTRQRRVLIGTQRCWVEFPGRASIRASTTLNVRLTKVKESGKRLSKTHSMEVQLCCSGPMPA